MRVPITLRLDADLLAAARVEAQRDSRTLTNLIEVALKRHLAGAGDARRPAAPGADMAQEPATAASPPRRHSGQRP
jgi:hypothetical protein